MKKIGIIILCFIIIFTLSSCGGNGKQNEDMVNYDTIENIYKNTQPRQEVKLGNLTFSGSVRVPNTSEVYTLKLARKDFVPDMEAMIKLYSDTYDPSIITKIPNQIPQDNIYETESFNLSAADGGFTYWPLYDGETKEGMFGIGRNTERVSITKPYRGEALSEEALQLTDGSLSMKQAGEEIETFLNEKFKAIEKIYDYKIRTVFTRKFDENTYCYEFLIERLYKGINFDSTILYNVNEDNIKQFQGNVSRVGMPLTIDVFSVGGYRSWYVSTRCFNYTVTSEQKLENKFITFDGALNILKKSVSSGAPLTINSAEFCYDISYPGYFPYYKMDEKDDPDKRFFDAIKEYTSIPVWMFIVDHENDPGMENFRDVHAAYMVNAVTGELYIYPCESHY